MKSCVVVVVVLALAAVGCDAVAPETATWYGSRKDGHIAMGVLDCTAGAACGSVFKERLQTGWDRLYVSVGDKVGSDGITTTDALYGAGYVEGMLTQQDMFYAFTNMYHQFFGAHPKTAKVDAWINKHWVWLEGYAAKHAPTDPYWASVQEMLAQFDGLAAGYTAAAPKEQQLTMAQLRILQLDGDLETITDMLDVGEYSFRPLVDSMGRCSVCIRFTGEELFMGHDTWDGYPAMVRSYKYYTLALTHPVSGNMVTTTVSLSSTPGFLASVDDWYVSSRGLMVTETTNDVYNRTLYDAIKPEGCVLSWMRTMIATYTASTGQEWGNIFSMYNSGTYNNQWIIVTMDKVTTGTTPKLDDGALWILEQLPGKIVQGDQTAHLTSPGYWASYNIPFYPSVYKESGTLAQYLKHGNAYSHEHCPRANIFRRDAPKVHTMEEYKTMMQYNDWQHDPLQLGSAGNGIMSRWDLVTGSDGAAFGGIDSKVATLAMARQLHVDAVNGPTHVQQPVYEWIKRWENVTHDGQPTRFDYEYQLMTPADPID